MSNLRSKYPTVPPSSGGGGGSINEIVPDTSAIIVTDPMGPITHLDLDEALLKAASAPLLQVDAIAGMAISARRAVYYDFSTNKVFHADSAAYNTALVLGVSKNSAILGGSVKVVTNGGLQDAGFAFTSNELLFLGSNGAITDVAPTTGYRTIIGKVLTNDTMFVNPVEPILRS